MTTRPDLVRYVGYGANMAERPGAHGTWTPSGIAVLLDDAERPA